MDENDEKQSRIAQMLADLPPASWAEARRRLSVVHRYATAPTRSKAEAEAHAAQLGIGLSLFYRLLNAYTRKPPETSTAARSAVRPEVHARIMRAIQEAGRQASPAQVLRRASQMCDEAGLPRPSQQAVRTRYWRTADAGSSGSRFGISVDRVLDRAQLDVAVHGGEKSGLVLTCVMDLARRRVAGHLVTLGAPSGEAVVELVRRVVGPGQPIGISVGDDVLHRPEVVAELRRQRIPPVAGGWRKGAAIRSVVGLRIGRIRVMERLPAKNTRSAPVDLATATDVVAALLARSYGPDPAGNGG